MMVGPCPAPSAVLIFVLYASFWNSVNEILPFGFAALKRLTVSSRMPCCGWPVRNQYVAEPAPALPPLDPPPLGPELPHAASVAAAPAPTPRLRKLRREIVLRSTLISILESRGLPRRFRLAESALARAASAPCPSTHERT